MKIEYFLQSKNGFPVRIHIFFIIFIHIASNYQYYDAQFPVGWQNIAYTRPHWI